MNRRVENEKVVLFLVDDVRWRRGETEISSDTAAYHEDRQWLRLTGNVLIREPDRTIFADVVDYYEDIDEAVATGQVQVVSGEGDQEMRTNRLIYNREKDRTTAFNRPVMKMIEVEEKDGESDTTTVVILGDRVLSIGEDSLFIVGDVSVESDSLTATCDSAFYDLENDWIRLRGDPVVTVTGYTAWGKEIDLHTPDDKLETAVIRGDARAEGSKDTGEEGEKTGQERYRSSADSLLLSFEEEKLKRLSAYSNAKSLVEREDLKKKVEKNYVVGDAIIVDMKEGKVGRVVVEGSGKGVYVIPPDTAKAGGQRAGE